MAEYKEFIKKELLGGCGYGLYGKILEIYWEQMEFLKTPSLFRKWLTEELEVPIEAINLSSLNSALQQRRRRKKQQNKDPANLTNPADDMPICDDKGCQG